MHKKNRDAWQIETGLGVHTPDVSPSPPPPSVGTHVVGGLDDDGGDEDAGDGVREPEAEAAAEDPDDDDPRREAVHPVVVGVGDRRVRLRRLPHRHHHLKEGDGWVPGAKEWQSRRVALTEGEKWRPRGPPFRQPRSFDGIPPRR